MRTHAGATRNGRGRLIRATLEVAALTIPILVGALTALQLRAQSPAMAGGKIAFDVVSVKQNKTAGVPHSNFPLGPGTGYVPNGGLFSATNMPLVVYMAFAYRMTGGQIQNLLSQVPSWVTADRFDVEARAEGNPTKDEMRLMMQSVLADRFKLAVHTETRQLPVFALVVVKAGKTGPQLRPHSEDPPCSAVSRPESSPDAKPEPHPTGRTTEFPSVCGGLQLMPPGAPGRVHAGARDLTMGLVASSLTGIGGFDRPVLDQTRLSGNFDFSIEFMPEPSGLPQPSVTSQSEGAGPTFLEALKEQLGLKLESQTGPVDVYVVDHVEEPSAN
jgi:uncharacterized protein (TIGR03435 family)